MSRHPQTAHREGFALVTVILVLAALLMLCTPFLLTARNADQASQQLFHRASARMALDDAATHARAALQRSHPSLDSTFYFDSLEELTVDNAFPDGFLDARDAEGIMWDVTATGVSSQIDLNSAPPQVLGAILGGVSRLVKPVKKDDKEIPLATVKGLDPSGYVWLGGELIHYGKIEANRLIELQRGLGVSYDADDNPLPGPRPPGDHGVGATVIDQRAFAPVEWRLFHGDVRDFDSYERLEEANAYAAEDARLTADQLAEFRMNGTVHGGVRAGARWQHAARLTSKVSAEVDGHLSVDAVRWFNPGSTIRITDGFNTELGVIRHVSKSGTIYLDRGISNSYNAYDAEVSVLSRRPVNINTASARTLEILLENLKLLGRNHRVSGTEARALASVIIESRPFQGFEDFLTRLVLPAAGIEPLPANSPVVPAAFAAGGGMAAGSGVLIDGWDAVAIYRNALNANDYALEYSTMPFCFSSNDVYDLDLRAVVNAPSGVERYARVRDETRLVTPQEELVHGWLMQEHFDEALRLNREAPYWTTGPAATSRHDPWGSTPPTRMWAHMGTWEGQIYLPGVVGQPTGDVDKAPTPEHVFADREDNGYIQLFAHQVEENADPEMTGRMLHFTHETRDPEGRYLPDQTIQYPLTNKRVQWDTNTNGVGLARGFHFSCWIKPRSQADAVLLDVGGSSLEADRISLLFEGGDLVLRVLDGGGDHRDTPQFEERSEVRYSIAQGEDAPGLPMDVWNHIEVDVRGSRPDQMMMLVNGLAHGVRTLGLTRLTHAIDENATTINVESVEGFPDRGVARIGNELVEYTLRGQSLEVVYNAVGPSAGFGGRNSRVQWSGAEPPIPTNIGLTAFNHPEGAAVELYGFAHQLASEVPPGSSNLADGLGAFRVAIVASVEGGPSLGDEVSVAVLGGSIVLGTGISGSDTSVTGLVLTSAENPEGGDQDSGLMEGFNKNGGYAALMQGSWGSTLAGVPIGSWTVIRYSGWDGNTLQVAAWGDAVPELKNLADVNYGRAGGNRAFVVQWGAVLLDGTPIASLLDERLFVVPISLPISGGNGASAFLEADRDNPRFAQITEPQAGELTEWVCYNSIQAGFNQLVRDDPDALFAARGALGLTAADREVDPPQPGTGGGGGGAGGGGAGGSGGFMLEPGAPPSNFNLAVAPSPPAASSAPVFGPQWQPLLGEAEDLDLPITRAVREAFQFRGVLGTYSHPHTAGAEVVPVFHLRNNGVDGGRPGRFDPVFLMEANFSHIGWPVVVYRGHSPSFTVKQHLWNQTTGELIAEDGGQTVDHANVGMEVGNVWFCTLDTAAPAPVAAGNVAPAGSGYTIVDSRAIGRMTRFPCGERPRSADTVTVGSAYSGGEVPAALIDEVLFGATEFGMGTPLVDAESVQAAQMILRDDFPNTSGQDIIYVRPNTIRIPLRLIGADYDYLKEFDNDAGLIRVGTEILAYQDLDNVEGEITVAENARGLLGTLEGTHEVGATLTFLDGFRVAILSAGIGADDGTIPVADTGQFPRQGTVLIGRELIHYTRLRNNALEMPRKSKEPGRMDGDGPGLLRGRYGTVPEAHSAGEPVIFFPIRYWDRWEERADAPELSYFGLELAQPAAFWKSFFWQDEEPGLDGVRLGVLMRSDADVPWDADPEETAGLDLFYSGSQNEIANPIGVQSNSVEWRVFIEYDQGAFDIERGLGHGWRATPRLTGFMVNYVGPSMTLRSVER